MAQQLKKFLISNKFDLLQAGFALVIVTFLLEFATGKNEAVLKNFAKVTAMLGSVTLIGSSVGLFLSGDLER